MQLDGSTVELMKGGSEKKVTYDNRLQYIELATQKLLHIADLQAKWVRTGVKKVCGKLNLFRLNWRILEERACGPPSIDLAYLKQYTENEVRSLKRANFLGSTRRVGGVAVADSRVFYSQ